MPFMRHEFLVLTVKKWLKSVYIYGRYREIKTGVSLFLDHSVHINKKKFVIFHPFAETPPVNRFA